MAKSKKKQKKAPSPQQLSPQKQDLKRPIVKATAEVHSGPLPPPSLLSQYDKVVPGAAEGIIAMAENQSKHRQELEAEVIT